jgi:hypothetical protein
MTANRGLPCRNATAKPTTRPPLRRVRSFERKEVVLQAFVHEPAVMRLPESPGDGYYR